MRTLKIVALAVLLLAAPAFGASVTLTGVGQTFAFDYNGIVDVGGVPTVMNGLTARVGFKVTAMYYDASLNRTIVEMDVVVHNTTDASIWQHATVSGIGFNTNPNVKRAGSGAWGDYNYIALNTTLPTGAGFMVEVCVSGRLNQCNGPASNATQIGQVGHASVQLAFYGNWTAPITLDNFGVRYADLFSTQYGINGYPGIGVPVTPPIPEPAAGVVFAIGALVLAAALRRRNVV
jgi:membrane protein implicated in regulation of membrane protease activity